MPTPKPSEFLSSAHAAGLFIVLISLTALAATFIASNLSLTFAYKLSIFVLTITVYLSLCAVVSLRQKRKIAVAPGALKSEPDFNIGIEAKLFALEEAHQFFGASLKYADMFRLVASRLNEMVPFETCVLLAANEDKSTLDFQFAVGENMNEFAGLKIRTGYGLAGKTLQQGTAQIAGNLSEDQKIISARALRNLESGIAAPLFDDAECFGVLVLYGAKKQFDQNSVDLLKAAAVRVAPLFISSRMFENNLSSALTDALTLLPNERAFYLVLENQIAEAQRFRGERPLTVLTMDVKNFSEINRKFGHATGDRLLGFAAETIKSQLRQMDFLARSSGDEFFAVLPTASEPITQEIVERVRKTFVLNLFNVTPTDGINLQLNFGASSFGKDGETATSLVEHALLKKQQSKTSNGENKILFFPKEFVN